MPDTWQPHGGDLPGLRVQLGLGCTELVDFSINLNPLGAPSTVLDALIKPECDWSVYPEPLGSGLREAAAGRHGVEPTAIIPGAGAAELLRVLVKYMPDRRETMKKARGEGQGRIRSYSLMEFTFGRWKIYLQT